ncbi:MAG: IS110 family RNA-guided transposase [Candidatus Dormibacteria bacterium]
MAVGEGAVIGGVDTHKEIHVAAVIDAQGRCLGSQSFAADARGYGRLLAWLRHHGELVAVGVEGTGSWGAGLARSLRAAEVAVVEVNRPSRQLRRQRGKSDPVDAEGAARAVLSGQATISAKSSDGAVECVRLLRVARRGALKARTQAIVQLQTVLDTSPEGVRARFRGMPRRTVVATAARLRPGPPTEPEAAAKHALATIARRWLALDEEVRALSSELSTLVSAAAPTLCARPGVGTDTAGALLVAAGDNPGRLHSEGAFAAVCGATPVEASSGKITRHRLNRGGNREANSALWRIVLVRLKSDARTRAYLERRTAEGRSKREVMRCLKRYVAREAYRAILRDLGGAKARTDGGDDSYDQRGQLNPDSRHFGEVTPGPHVETTPLLPSAALVSL